MSSPVKHRRVLGVAAAVLAVSQLAACTKEEPPTLVKLRISDQGAYSIDEAPVAREALAAALDAKKQPPRTLLVQVVASPSAKSEAVLHATKIAQDAGASLAFVGNEKF
jgi:biopolymer transport protein ExbD